MSSRKVPTIDEREWEMQERALRAARGGGTDAMDPAEESYRRIATALISAPRSEPPPDFASAVVEQVPRGDAGIEPALFRTLLLVLAAASIIVTALYGGQWWQAMQGALTGGALQWVMAGTACVALSWMIGRLHQVLAPRTFEPRP